MSDRRNHPISDFSACPCSGGTLDKLVQPAILATLAQGELHGYKIAQRVGEMPILKGRQPDVSGIYRSLKAMEAHGMVVSAWDVSGSGPAKKSYRITAAGGRCLARWIETLEEYHRAIASLLEAARAAAAGESRPRRQGSRRCKCASTAKE